MRRVLPGPSMEDLLTTGTRQCAEGLGWFHPHAQVLCQSLCFGGWLLELSLTLLL
jgi:hypothetical protein